MAWNTHPPFRWTSRVVAGQSARMSLLLALLSCWICGAPCLAAAVERIDVSNSAVVITFDGRVGPASAFVLDAPDRVAVDIDDAAPGGVVTNAADFVGAVRQGTRPGGARIVLDLSAPAIVTSGRFDDDRRTLTLSMQGADDARFAEAAATRRMTLLPPFNYAGLSPSTPRYRVSQSVPPPARRLSLPRILGDDASRPLVVIDAGHGGFDPGAIAPADGLREKDVTLRIAKAVRDRLAASGRVRVALTREDDRFLILQERYGIARKLKADLFISIHCDSIGAGDASGATIYTLSEVASDKQAARLAARENKADVIAGVDLGGTSPDISSILIDLTQRETMNRSASFAQLLGREASPLMPIKPNFHRMASLMVLKAPDMPSILFETGYISNPRDAQFISSQAGRDAIAESILRAVTIHFARRMAAN